MSDIAQRVDELVQDCLFAAHELTDAGRAPESAVVVEGIMAKFFFHPQRLAAHKADIAALCNELPEEFQKTGGGGWSFLKMCMTKAGEQWGEHRDCELLTVLALGTGQGSFLLPRNLWDVLPGGMPYVAFDTRLKN
jgi:hypothetical protein